MGVKGIGKLSKLYAPYPLGKLHVNGNLLLTVQPRVQCSSD